MKCSMLGFFLNFIRSYFCYRIVGMRCGSSAFVSWCDVVTILGASSDIRSFEGVGRDGYLSSSSSLSSLGILYNVINNTA